MLGATIRAPYMCGTHASADINKVTEKREGKGEGRATAYVLSECCVVVLGKDCCGAYLFRADVLCLFLLVQVLVGATLAVPEVESCCPAGEAGGAQGGEKPPPFSSSKP